MSEKEFLCKVFTTEIIFFITEFTEKHCKHRHEFLHQSFFKGGFLDFLTVMFSTLLTYRPSDSTVSEDAGIFFNTVLVILKIYIKNILYQKFSSTSTLLL